MASDIAVPLRSQDTPRLAYSALERRATLTTVGLLVALAALSWWSTVGNADDMSTPTLISSAVLRRDGQRLRAGGPPWP